MTVLIADGDFQRGKRLAAACEQLGLGANVATHGAAALEIALSKPPSVLIAQLGLPLIDAYISAGFQAIGFDVDSRKADSLNNGQS